MAYAKAPHHTGPHDRLAAQARAVAYANPDYRCPTCRLTLTEGIARWGDNGKWEGGHRVHGRSEYGYHAQHRHCNRSDGASHGNQQRAEPHSERW